MSEYIVDVPELHEARYKVIANSEEEARQKARDADYEDVVDIEFEEVIKDDWEHWFVMKVSE